MDKKVKDKTDELFKGFSILKGEFVKPEEESDIDDSTGIVEDDIVDENEQTEEAKRLAAGDAALEKLAAEKAKKASKTTKVETTEEDEVEDGEVEDTDEENSLFKVFTKDLYNDGALDFDDSDEEFEESKEGISKLVKKTVANRINNFVENLPEDFKTLLEFVENGGKPKDFIKTYYEANSWEDLDIENEDNQKLIVAESLRLAGETEEDITDMVTEWYDNGTLQKRAKSGQAKLIKYTESQKVKIVEEQRLQAETLKKAEEKKWNDMKTELMSKEEVMGFKLTPKVREKLWEFVTIPDRKTGKTGYQEAIESKKDAQWLFAYQAMNNFDKSKLEVQTRTKVSKEFGNLLSNYAKTSKEKIAKGSTDDNYGTNPFEAFKTR